MRSFISIAMIVAAAGVFYFGIDPAYNSADGGIKVLRATVADYNTALDNSAELRKVRGALISKYNNLDKTNLDRLAKLLPDGVDNVRLILDINSMAAKYGMSIKNIKITQDNVIGTGATPASNQNPVGSIKLSFAVTTSYENYLQFLTDMEKSLRIVDVVGLSFVTNDKDNTVTYTTILQTYWLK